ncbi:MAG: hypothetical protein HQL70_09005 [Magnetococcales bacterium]|nr:hypothetical protein [Magnetococcales bacterium]
MKTNSPFDDWITDIFCEYIGITKRRFYENINWGGKQNSLVQIPKINRTSFNSLPNLGFKDKQPWISWSGEPLKPYQIQDDRLVFNFDVITAAGWLLCGCEEQFFDKRENYGRWDDSQSVVLKSGFTNSPVINIWANVIRDFLVDANVKDGVPLWPEGKKFAVCLSHDVDNPYYSVHPHIKRFALAIKNRNWPNAKHSLLKIASSSIINFQDRFRSSQGFVNIINKEHELGVQSSIFLCPKDPSLTYATNNDPIYSLDEQVMATSIERARSFGFDLGLHALMDTAPHKSRYREQCEIIENSSQRAVTSQRHHYWNLAHQKSSESFVAMADSGIKYDSSLSFYDAPNFRRGVALPFSPFCLKSDHQIKLLEIPPMFMDDWLDRDKPLEHVTSWIEKVENVEGVATLNWHINRFNNRRFLWQGEIYLDVVKNLAKREDVWLASLSEIGSWWEQRREKIL